VPLYFFHVVDGEFLVDATGTQCAGMSEVRHQAIKTAGEILADKGARFPNGLEWQMHVTNASNKTVLKLKFSAEEPKV
jgi:hypothetical protein